MCIQVFLPSFSLGCLLVAELYVFFNIFQILNPYQVCDLLIFPPLYRSSFSLWNVPCGVFCLSSSFLFSWPFLVLGLCCSSIWWLASQEVPERHLQGGYGLKVRVCFLACEGELSAWVQPPMTQSCSESALTGLGASQGPCPDPPTSRGSCCGSAMEGGPEGDVCGRWARPGREAGCWAECQESPPSQPRWPLSTVRSRVCVAQPSAGSFRNQEPGTHSWVLCLTTC